MAMSPYADPTPSYEQSQWLPDSANAFSIPQTHYPPTQYDYHTPQPSAYTSASISHNPDPSSHNTAAVSPNPSSGASSNTQQQQQQQTSSPSMPRPTLVQLGASQNYLVNNRPAPWIKVLDVDPTYRPSRPPSPRNAPGKSSRTARPLIPTYTCRNPITPISTATLAHNRPSHPSQPSQLLTSSSIHSPMPLHQTSPRLTILPRDLPAHPYRARTHRARGRKIQLSPHSRRARESRASGTCCRWTWNWDWDWERRKPDEEEEEESQA